MFIEKYIKPATIEEAYKILSENEGAMIIGGGLFSKIAPKKISNAIDLSNLSLEFIKEYEDRIEIGAMATLGDIEKSKSLKQAFGGVLPSSVKNIVGVQFRNLATVGGTVFGRYGFSELNTALLALDADVILHKSGEIKLSTYFELKNREKDIIKMIVIKNKAQKASYEMFRNSLGDFPLLCCAVSKDGDNFRISVGGRPKTAKISLKASEYLKNSLSNKDVAIKAGEVSSQELDFATDVRAGREYRQELCKVIVKRAILEVLK